MNSESPGPNRGDTQPSASPSIDSDVRSALVSPSPSQNPPTQVRHSIIAVSVLMAISLYLNRVCFGEISKSEQFVADFNVSKKELGEILGAFFFTYALFQVPAGWISDRFGARWMLSIYILSWSLLTGITGFISSSGALLFARLAMGAAQAGAYPTSSAIVRRWIPAQSRGRASSMVSFGGRFGGTVAPYLTASLVLLLSGWRPTVITYGVMGVLTAIAYWWIVRDRPSEHSRCNDAERALIGQQGNEDRPTLASIIPMLIACCKSPSLWLNSATQFFVNVGWAFLITWLPTYLREAKQVESQTGAFMVTLVLAHGIIGQLIGGVATDLSVRKLGLRIGRVLPISVACVIAGIAYMSCARIESTWGIIACCALVSLMTDVGNPSIWAFMQDVGGKNTAAFYGWGNMWGNFGAALSSVMLPWLQVWGAPDGAPPSEGNWLVFLTYGSAFILAGIAAAGMDATRPLQQQSPPQKQP